MRPYEIVLILDTAIDEAGVDALVTRVTDLLKSQGGTLGRVERWGRRRLAYEIEKKTEGYYVLIESTAEPSGVAALDRTLFLTDGIIRHKILRVPPQAVGRSLAAPPALEEMTLGGGPRERD